MDIKYSDVVELINRKLIEKTDDTPYEELSEYLFGEGNCFNESEVRKRMYGMKRLIEIIENEENDHVATRILSISDLHFPFQLDYKLLEKYRYNIDVLQINGDVIDCQVLSKFPKQYRHSVMDEIIGGRQYLINLIEYINPSKVVCNYGNHDKRLAMYLAKNIDTDVLELLPDTSLDMIFEDGFMHYDKKSRSKTWYDPLCKIFKDIEIVYCRDWKSRIGKTVFVHPMAFRKNILATTVQAKSYLQDTQKEDFDCVCMAHTHQVGDSKHGYIRLLEQGAFANVEQLDYLDGKLTNPQKAGFAIICQDEEGNLIQEKTKIVVLN